MSMSPAEKRILAFCARRELQYEWQKLRFDGRRVMIHPRDRLEHDNLLTAAKRLKDVHVDEWRARAIFGVYDGVIYLQDAAEAARIGNTLKEEAERVENWWQVYHNCLGEGMSTAEAQRKATALFPDPATA